MTEQHNCHHVWDGSHRDVNARCMWPMCRDLLTATCSKPDYRYPGSEVDHLRAILAERDAEIERLRGMALDLSKVSEEWSFVSVKVQRNRAWLHGSLEPLSYGALLEQDGGDSEAFGTGPTPAAALNAAIKRTKNQR